MEETKFKKRKEKALIDGNLELLAINCKYLGDYYNEHGEYRKAIREYMQEADVYKKLCKELEMAKAQRMVGEMYMLLCDFDKAKQYINSYLKLVKKLQNKVEEQRAYATLGRAYLLHSQSCEEPTASTTLYQLRAAEKAFLHSLMLTKRITNEISKLELLDMQARCYLNIGVVKENMGNLENAIEYIEKAIKISTTHDIFELTHMCYISMSLLLHIKKNDCTAALRYCNLALQVAKRLPEKVKKICETLIIKAEILIKATDFASAKQILIKAYKKNTPDKNDRANIEKTLRTVVVISNALDELITTNIEDHEKRKMLYERIGDYCCQLECYAKAAEYYQNMLECAKKLHENGKTLAPIYVSLYQTYKDDKQYDKALEYMWAEYEVFRAENNSNNEAFTTLCSIAEILELQEQGFFIIYDVYQKALMLANSMSHSDNSKLLRVAYARLINLCSKHNMHVLMEDYKKEAEGKGINTMQLEHESDSEGAESGSEPQTDELGATICLDDLTDSDASDADEGEKLTEKRTTRGQRGFNIKRNNKGETTLHQACIAGNYELVRRLLEQGHVINVRDHAGWLPLHEACNHGHRHIVELLLDRGAAVAVNDKGGTNCDGITPLYDACSNGYLDVVDLLLDRGADATLKTDFGETCVDGLDKWRNSASLDAVEQAQYQTIRDRLMGILTKIGIKPKSHAVHKNVPNNYDERRNRLLALHEREEMDSDSDYDKTLVFDAAAEDEENKNMEHRSNYDDYDDDDDDLNMPKPRKLTSKAGASAEYRNIMDHLKRKNRGGVKSIPNSLMNKSKRAAFMESQEIDDAMWLIDDVGPEKKKCRYKSPTRDMSLMKERQNNSKQNSPLSVEKKVNSKNTFDTLFGAAQKCQKANTVKRKLSLSRTSSSSLGSRASSTSKQQSLLSDAGFFRFRSESPLNISGNSKNSSNCSSPTNVSIKDVVHLVISPTKLINQSPLQPSAILPANIYFKVRVEAEMLLISIERRKISEYTIKWLAEDAARRYYDLVGLKPILRLKTADGFAFEEKDALSVAAEHNLIVGTVVEWKIASLTERYKEMCQQINEDIYEAMLPALEHAEVTNQLEITKWLTYKQFKPIFKALLHQTKLSTLDLSYNMFGTKGCKELSKILPTLINLTTLKLRCNHISTEDLKIMLLNADMEKLTDLREIDLSQNEFGNDGVAVIAKYCQTTAAQNALRRISLSQCNIEQLPEGLFVLPLSHLDISFNKLTNDALKQMLLNLKETNLEELKLSYAFIAHNNPFATEILTNGLTAKNLTKLRHLTLGGLKLNDSQFYTIITNLSDTNSVLEVLDITNNKLLTTASLHYVYKKLPFIMKFIALQNRELLNGNDTFTILRSWSSQFQFPQFMIVHLPLHNAIVTENDNDTKNNDDNIITKEIKSLWKERWGDDRGKFKQINDILVLYTDERDYQIYFPCS